MIKRINNDQRGLLFKNGNYERYLRPGKHYFNPFVKCKVYTMNVDEAFSMPGKNINMFLNDKDLLKGLTVVDVKNNEIAIHFEDGILTDVLETEKYAFWNVLKKHGFIVVDLRDPEVKGTGYCLYAYLYFY